MFSSTTSVRYRRLWSCVSGSRTEASWSCLFARASSALRAAKESEARWKDGRSIGVLDGVPFTAKDNLMVRGYPFRRGSVVTPAEGTHRRTVS